MTNAIDLAMSVQDHIDLYHALGFNIIPLRPKDKRPAVSELATYFQRKSVYEEWDGWWDCNKPSLADTDNNIGVVTGAISNVIVLDLDNEEAYAAVMEGMPWLADTLRAETGKGYHIYLRPEQAPGPTFTMNYGEEHGLHHIKADGGYVVAPPSNHPNGNVYTLVPNPLLGVDLAVLVKGLLACGFTRHKREAEDRPANWFEELFSRRFGEGERTQYAESLIGLLRYYIRHRPGLSLGLMMAWNQVHCNPPLPEAEVEMLVRSYYRRYAD